MDGCRTTSAYQHVSDGTTSVVPYAAAANAADFVRFGHLSGLTTIPSGVFHGSITTELWLEYNSITSNNIGDDAFNQLTSLNILKLHSNLLTVVKATWFANMTSLQEIYLHMNDIDIIESGTFADNVNLNILELWDNAIKELPYDMFDLDNPPINITSLVIGQENSLNCTCVICWLKHADKSWVTVKPQTSPVTWPTTCWHPAALSGQQWSLLSAADMGCSQPCSPSVMSIENALSLEPNPGSGVCGAIYKLQCATGHKALPSSSGPMFCDTFGNWTNRPRCEANICDSSTYTIANGLLYFPNISSPHGTYYSAKCDPGYSMNANSTGPMDCDSNGVFTNKPACIPNVCLNSSLVVKYGDVHFPNILSPTRTEYNVSCYTGFTPSDQNNMTGTLECQSDGTWGNKPVCFMPWKSPSLSDFTLADVTDNNPLTAFTLHKSNCLNFDLWLPDLNVTSTIKVNISGMGLQCESGHSVLRPIEISTGTDTDGLHKECSLDTGTINDEPVITCMFTCYCTTTTCYSLHVLIRREAILGISGQIQDITYTYFM